MVLMNAIQKTDEDVQAYDADFSRWLGDTDQVVSATATIEDSSEDPSTLAAAITATTTDRVKFTLSAGTAGESAMVKIVATTANGLVKELNFPVRISER